VIQTSSLGPSAKYLGKLTTRIPKFGGERERKGSIGRATKHHMLTWDLNDFICPQNPCKIWWKEKLRQVILWSDTPLQKENWGKA
jgi:hypothetical protein